MHHNLTHVFLLFFFFQIKTKAEKSKEAMEQSGKEF